MREEADSIHKVRLTLENHPGLRTPQIEELSGVPRRTVRFALHRLLEQKAIVARRSLKDTRMVYYFPASYIPAKVTA